MGPHDRPPRRYRGHDFVWWLGALGKWDAKAATPGTEHVTIAVSATYAGHTVDFRRLAARGITLLGRVEGYRDGALAIAPSLALAQMVVRRVAPRPGAASGGVVVTKAPAPAAGAPDAGLLPPPPLYEALFREFLGVSNVYVRGKLFASGMRALALALTLLFCLPRPHRRPQHSRGHPRAPHAGGVPGG